LAVKTRLLLILTLGSSMTPMVSKYASWYGLHGIALATSFSKKWFLFMVVSSTVSIPVVSFFGEKKGQVGQPEGNTPGPDAHLP
jgi:hypothetical protein